MVGVDRPVQIQRPYRPPVVHRKRDPGQHILLSCPGAEQKACAVPEEGGARAHFGKRNRILLIPLLYLSLRPVWKCRASVLRTMNRPGRM